MKKFMILLTLTLVACGPSLEERRAAAPAPVLVTILDVKEGYETEEEDDEHFLTTEELGTLPIEDSQLWATDDDATLAGLQAAQRGGGQACVRTEQGFGGATFVAKVEPKGACQ